MAASRVGGVDCRERRSWSFADCIFDEANWSLFVGGSRVAIEIKPLEFLRELLLRAGNVVSKEELLDAIWPDVEVVEASLTTAVRKLRTALRDDRRKVPIIETVPRIGYRLAVSVEVQDPLGTPAASPVAARPAQEPAPQIVIGPAVGGGRPAWLAPRLLSISGAVAIALAAIAVATTPSQNASATRTGSAYAPQFTQRDAAVAMRKLEIGRIETMLAAGWDPNAYFDKEGTDALMYLLNMCEWDPGHNRRQMLLMARTLLEGGVKIDHRNVYGDTAYSIAKAQRYCGPDHPVTQMLEAMCYGGSMGPKDLCLATYELDAEQRRAQGLPPKG